jgi:predicted homoserine dehydrogenase-like protein
MILVDRALQKRHRENRPIRVGMVGAGFMARGIALQILQSVSGMRLIAIANRHVSNAQRAFREAGADVVHRVETVAQLEDGARKQHYLVTDDPLLLCSSPSVDVVIEVTGTVELGARVALEAIRHGKHVVLMNAELDGTIGPILQTYAKQRGVVLTNADGDQPGVLMNLFRFVGGIGVRPVLCGSIKGLHDPYRTPTTQAAFAQKWGQNPAMVTSFADGTKISSNRRSSPTQRACEWRPGECSGRACPLELQSRARPSSIRRIYCWRARE